MGVSYVKLKYLLTLTGFYILISIGREVSGTFSCKSSTGFGKKLFL
jgi:hypothetical protein